MKWRCNERDFLLDFGRIVKDRIFYAKIASSSSECRHKNNKAVHDSSINLVSRICRGNTVLYPRTVLCMHFRFWSLVWLWKIATVHWFLKFWKSLKSLGQSYKVCSILVLLFIYAYISPSIYPARYRYINLSDICACSSLLEFLCLAHCFFSLWLP